MTDKVVALPGAPVPGYQVVPETVEILRGMLALAERGEVRSLAIAYTDADRKVVTNWHNNGEYFLMIGGVAWLQQRMLEGSNTD